MVLHDDDGIVREIATKEVEREATYWMLGYMQFEFDPENISEAIGVTEQPRREVMCFVSPHIPRRDLFETAQIHSVHSTAS